ncbi:MAG: DUF2892 domain-containing protein [Polyangiales bacterium]
MELKKLVTLTFAPNVGAKDRVFRLLSGAALGLGPWWADLPRVGAVALSVLGAMWFATGVLSKCSIYYLLGYSSCPASGERLRGDAGGAP